MREKLTATGLDAGPDTIRWHLEHHDESAQVVNTDGLQSRESNDQNLWMGLGGVR